MALLGWKAWRWVLILIAGATAATLFNISSAVGITLESEFITGVTMKTIIGLANVIAAYALYKEL